MLDLNRHRTGMVPWKHDPGTKFPFEETAFFLHKKIDWDWYWNLLFVTISLKI